jgi:hypothetical protein
LADLRSAPPPEPGDEDHARGPADARLVIEYADYECPYCARTDAMLADSAVRHVFRHFPVPSKHPRARALAGAVEAAALQGRFWDMHDSLFADQGRIDDPHLWERARRLDLDLGADRPGLPLGGPRGGHDHADAVRGRRRSPRRPGPGAPRAARPRLRGHCYRRPRSHKRDQNKEGRQPEAALKGMHDN